MCYLGHDTLKKQTQIFTTATTIVCMCFISLFCLTNMFETAVEYFDYVDLDTDNSWKKSFFTTKDILNRLPHNIFW